MRFLIKIKGKQEQIKLENIRYQKPVETTVKKGQLKWLGHVIRREAIKLIKHVYHAKEIGKRGEADQEVRKEVCTAVEKRE